MSGSPFLSPHAPWGSASMISPSRPFCSQPLNLCRHWPRALDPRPAQHPTSPASGRDGPGQTWGCWESLEGRRGGRGAGQLACVPTLGPGPSQRGGGLATRALAGAGFLAGLQGPPSCFLSRGLSWQRPPLHFLAGTGPAVREQLQRESGREMGETVCVCVCVCVCVSARA